MRLVLVLLLAACAAPALPPATSRGEALVPVSAGDLAYWIARTADGWSLVRRAAGGAVTVVDSGPLGRVSEDGSPAIVVGDDVLVWGFSGEFTREAKLDVVRPDGTVSKLDLSHAPAGYQGLPLAETGGHLVLADGLGGFDVLELATGAISKLGGARVAMRDAAVVDGATDALLGMCFTDDATFVGELDASAPQSSPLRDVAQVARDGAGPIVRVDAASGHTERFAVPYEPLALAALPDRLLVGANVDAGGQTLTEMLEQPLP